MRNIEKDTRIIKGPAGSLKVSKSNKPKIEEITPIKGDKIKYCFKLLETKDAAAAGITTNAIVRIPPTILTSAAAAKAIEIR